MKVFLFSWSHDGFNLRFQLLICSFKEVELFLSLLSVNFSFLFCFLLDHLNFYFEVCNLTQYTKSALYLWNNPFTSSSSLNFPCSNSLIFWNISCFPCSMLIDFLKPSAVLDSYNVCKRQNTCYTINLQDFYKPHRVSMQRHSRLISQPEQQQPPLHAGDGSLSDQLILTLGIQLPPHLTTAITFITWTMTIYLANTRVPGLS